MENNVDNIIEALLKVKMRAYRVYDRVMLKKEFEIETDLKGVFLLTGTEIHYRYKIKKY